MNRAFVTAFARNGTHVTKAPSKRPQHQTKPCANHSLWQRKQTVLPLHPYSIFVPCNGGSKTLQGATIETKKKTKDKAVQSAVGQVRDGGEVRAADCTDLEPRPGSVVPAAASSASRAHPSSDDDPDGSFAQSNITCQ